MEKQDVKHVLQYLQSEISRIETMAGTLSGVEREHFQRLTNFDQRELVDIAVEEQSASRQLGAIQQMCQNMSRQIGGMLRSTERGADNEVH
ncbi:hypothetical protein IJ21_17160 [Paenibacillus sp. 32O-W]|uniref:hypothetical protein n=1 Tax=Paenibacillus sp. 32O-W TaxID=1695218 RepID=UPI0007207797|nr:hypothetical protein [Paenibacillus sp. 32O-W]ALS27117.1 hypothetical protein IJ21_17160 [Paenibacillus sp. 32O-W]